MKLVDEKKYYLLKINWPLNFKGKLTSDEVKRTKNEKEVGETRKTLKIQGEHFWVGVHNVV